MIRLLLAYLAVGLTVASLLVMLLLGSAGDGLAFEELGGAITVMGLLGVGVLVLVRRPENLLGPVFAATGVLWALTGAAKSYAALGAGPVAAPGASWAALFGSWASDLAWGVAVTFGFLLFPNGRLPSRRWRIVAWTAAASLVAFGLTAPFVPGPLSQMPSLESPLAVEGFGPVARLMEWVEGIFLLCVVASFASAFVRYRGATPVERQQIKWVAYIAALLALDFAASEMVRIFWGGSRALDALVLAGALLFAAFPLSIGVAVMRYRLYDIDRVINRTLVYGALTASLVLVYFGSVVSLQYAIRALTGGDSRLAIVASTLAIAALFNPLRRRIQAFIDRRFYRRKYDAAKTLQAFSTRLRDETELGVLEGDLLDVIGDTLQPEYASLWLRPAAGEKR